MDRVKIHITDKYMKRTTILFSLLLSCTLIMATDHTALPQMAPLTVEQAVSKGNPFRLEWETFSLSADSGALMHDITIRLSVFGKEQAQQMPSNMGNVTGQVAESFCLLPNGVHFEQPAVITVPYDIHRLPAGYNTNDIFTFYYDEELRSWKKLERLGIDTILQTISSYTTHFTEFANAVIKVPEMPEAAAFVPTAMTDLPDVNPLQGIPMIAAPQANNRGTAELTYPIEIPKGRGGLQPNIDLHYSSAAGNGILGIGWDINVPAITIDTRWGVPRYNVFWETEAYLLNGEQLLLVTGENSVSALPHHAREVGYAKRYYGHVDYRARDSRNQNRIVRYGNSLDSLWWCVTDVRGTKYYYGYDPITQRIDESALVRTADGYIAHWALSYVIDMSGNYIQYEYDNYDNTVDLRWIHYTGNVFANLLPTYHVYFQNHAGRSDVESTGRLGILQQQKKRLLCLSILYNEGSSHITPNDFETLWQYHFAYECGPSSLNKSRLTTITKYDRPWCEECEYHKKEYIVPQKESWTNLNAYLVAHGQSSVKPIDDVLDDSIPGSRTQFRYNDATPIEGLFSDARSIKQVEEINSSENNSWSIGGTAAIGLGPVTSLTTLSVGGNYSYSRSTGGVSSTLMDMDGDGLVDLVFEDGKHVKYHRQLLNGSFESLPYTIPGIVSLSRDVSSSHNFGVQADFGSLDSLVQANISFAPTLEHSYTDIYFTDVNADGLPDLVFQDSIYINYLDNGRPSFLPMGESKNVAVGNSSCGMIKRTGEVSPDLECESQWVLASVIPLGKELQYTYEKEKQDSVLEPDCYFGKKPTCESFTPEIPSEAKTEFNESLPEESVFEAPAPSSPLNAEPMQPQFWLADGYSGSTHKTIVKGDSLYVYVLNTSCEEKNDIPNVDIVRVWVAKEAGTISLRSAIRLLPDTSVSRRQSRKADGVKYYIQKNNSVVKSGYISANDHLLHTDSFISLNVVASDVLLFRLSAGDDRRFDNVEWEQNIVYLSGTRKTYNSSNDYVCAGNKDFVAPSSGSVYAGYTLYNNQPAPYYINVLIHDSSSSVRSVSQNQYIHVNEGDRISFSITYPPIGPEPQWSNLRIYPYVNFVSSENVSDTLYFHPDVNVQCSSILPDSARYRKIFGLLHKGWGQFAYNNSSNDSIICLDSLYNAEDAAVLALQAEDSRRGVSAIRHRLRNRLLADSADLEINSEKDTISLSVLNSYVDSLRSFDPLKNGSKWIGMHPDSKTNTWYAYGNLGFLGQRLHSTSQFIENKSDTMVVDIEYDSAIPISADGSSVTTIRKKTSSKQYGISVGLGVGLMALNKNLSYGTHSVDMDVLDMNGDGFPDLVSTSSIQFTTPWGGLESGVTPISVASPSGRVFSEGEGASGGINIAKFTTANNPKKKIPFNASVGTTWNRSNISFIDMNADGLPDAVDVTVDSVWYNLGYSFSDGYPIPSALSINSGKSENISVNGSLPQSLQEKLSQLVPRGKNISSKCQFSLSAGIGGSFSDNQVLSQLTDIDGDGSPDMVVNDEFGTKVSVINNDSISASAPISGLSLGSYSANVSTSACVTTGFSPGLYKYTIGVHATPWAKSWTFTHGMLLDFNGDGFVDMVHRDYSDSLTIRENQNGLHPVNLLTSVTNPTGQTIQISYKQTAPSVQQKGRRWQMQSVCDVIEDSIDGTHLLSQSFEYADPFHDNFEKTDYGYGFVSTVENNEKVFQETFYNQEFATKGEKRSDLLIDMSRNNYIGHRHELDYSNRQAASTHVDLCNDTALFLSAESFWTDYYSDEGLELSTRYTLEFDSFHNLIRRVDYGDTAIVGDEFVQTISYCTPQANRWRYNLVSLPQNEKVTDLSGHLLRKSSCYYDSFGRPIVIVKHDTITNMEAATYLEYDALGNISRIILPENRLTGQPECPWTAYLYDAITGSYPLVIGNQFGEKQIARYDYRHGVPLCTVDPAGNGIVYQYDYMGRLISVTAPHDYLKDSVPTIQYYYRLQYHDLGDLSPRCRHPYVVKIGLSRGVPSISASTYDQRGQMLLKRSLRSIGGDQTWVADGFAYKDAFYRQYKVLLPFVSDPSFDSVDPSDNSPFSWIYYDALDRIVGVKNPDHSLRRTQYTFGPDYAGNLRLQTELTDENCLITKELLSPQEWRIQTETADSAITKYSYNAIGELLQVTDADGYQTSYAYDMFGNCVERNHPDAGLTQWQYAPLGNLISMQTAVLRETSDKITYLYDYNRLRGVVYPLHPENNVSYMYDFAGRIHHRTDGSGSEDYFYDELGNVSHSVRRITVPSERNNYVFKTGFEYDSFGRMMSIQYPDKENVYYRYDIGGMLEAVYGIKNHCRHDYLSLRHYDVAGHKIQDDFGNGVTTLYSYNPERQWLDSLYTYSSATGDVLQAISYSHDAIGNITLISQGASNLSNNLGGKYENSYSYDEAYRLVSSKGIYDFPYDFYASYSPSGRLGTKIISSAGRANSSLYYGYDAYGRSHQIRTSFDAYSGNVDYFWDANGNMLQMNNCDWGTRYHEWDEENRLRLVLGENYAGFYGYDANGQRVYKLTGTSRIDQLNSGDKFVRADLDELTLYPNPYMVVSGKEYTKHYYAGSERLATSIGGGGLADVIPPIDSVRSPRERFIRQMFDKYKGARYPFGVLDIDESMEIIDIEGNDSSVLKYHCTPEKLEWLELNVSEDILFPVMDKASQVYQKEDQIYFYHTDHLGSASWITDSTGHPIQYIHYAPYGELIDNQQATGYDERFKFTGKERDWESGYDFFGARFLWSDVGIWLSVDPLADLYTSLSPYMYCMGNPIMIYDPNGCGDPLTVMRVRRMQYKNTFGPNMRRNGTRCHQGIDYYAPKGTDIMAVKNGTIESCNFTGRKSNGEESDYGLTITLSFEDENGKIGYAFYAHLSEIDVQVGDKVKEGDLIGKTGNTGNAKDMKGEDQHLHFEYRLQKNPGLGISGRDDPNKIVDTKFRQDPENPNAVIEVSKREKIKLYENY